MDRIHYAGDSIVTGTQIAHALLDYAQALAQVEASDTVELPTIAEDGSVSRSELLVGPASQLISSAEQSGHEELVDEKFLAVMKQKTEALRMHGAPPTSGEVRPGEPADGWSDYDLI